MGHRVCLPCLYYYLSLTLLCFGKLFSMPVLSHFPSYLCSLHQSFPYLCYHSSFLPYHLPPLSHILVYLFVYFVYSHLQHSQNSPLPRRWPLFAIAPLPVKIYVPPVFLFPSIAVPVFHISVVISIIPICTISPIPFFKSPISIVINTHIVIDIIIIVIIIITHIIIVIPLSIVPESPIL